MLAAAEVGLSTAIGAGATVVVTAGRALSVGVTDGGGVSTAGSSARAERGASDAAARLQKNA